MNKRRRNPYAYTSGLSAGVWVVAGFAQPETNFFLFPALVAGLMPIAYRLDAEQPLSWPAAAGTAISGLINVGVALGMLLISDNLRGQPIIGTLPLWLEAFLIGVAGGSIGAVVAGVGSRQSQL